MFFKGIIDKIKGLGKEKEILKGSIYSNTVYTNNHLEIVSEAFRECWGSAPKETFEDKLGYVSRGVRMGHESVLEHSNVITQYMFNKDYLQELAEVLTCCKYLNTKVYDHNGILILIIGGSIRGYKHIIRTIKNPENRLAKVILEEMYNLHSCYFVDFIDDGIMDQNRFLDVEDESLVNRNSVLGKEYYDIINIDDINTIYNNCICNSQLDVVDDMLDMTTITIHFKNISRLISQQYTRHRAGITQLSQRYVDCTGFRFNPPHLFKPDMYDKDTRYKVSLAGQEFEFTQQDLGDALVGLYGQLIAKPGEIINGKPIEGKMLKEDARSYSPGSMITSFYMTFTIRNFIKFLQLRTEKGAQAEIKLNAKDLEKDLNSFLNENIGNLNIYEFLLPNYKIHHKDIEEEDIDEVIK